MVQASQLSTEIGTADGVSSIAQAALDLEKQGWAVIPGVLSSADCEEYVSAAWAWLESLETGIDRHDSTTWGDDRWPSNFRGIINTLEISHQDFVWRVRQHPKILQVKFIPSPLLQEGSLKWQKCSMTCFTPLCHCSCNHCLLLATPFLLEICCTSSFFGPSVL